MEPLFVVSLMLGLLATGYLWRRDHHALRRGLPPRRERDQRTLRPGDVLQLPGAEHLIEQVSRLEETGQARLLCRLSGGRHLWVRPPGPAVPPEPDDELWLLAEAPLPFEVTAGAAPEQLALGGLRFRLSGHFPVEATLVLGGAPHGAGGAPALGQGAERVIEYRGVGAERLLLLVGEGGLLGLRGEALPAHRVQLLLAP